MRRRGTISREKRCFSTAINSMFSSFRALMCLVRFMFCEMRCSSGSERWPVKMMCAPA